MPQHEAPAVYPAREMNRALSEEKSAIGKRFMNLFGGRAVEYRSHPRPWTYGIIDRHCQRRRVRKGRPQPRRKPRIVSHVLGTKCPLTLVAPGGPTAPMLVVLCEKKAPYSKEKSSSFRGHNEKKSRTSVRKEVRLPLKGKRDLSDSIASAPVGKLLLYQGEMSRTSI